MRQWSRDHIDQCNTLTQDNPVAMRNAAMMAVLSIQQNWDTVPHAAVDVAEKGIDSRYIWGFKYDTYEYLHDDDNMENLFTRTLTEDDPVKLLDLWTTVPGLGLAKAGFVVQLTRGMIGCVDSHNAKLYDVHPSALVFPKGRMTLDAAHNKLQAYVNLTTAVGGSQFMWEQWCILMAEKYPSQFSNAKSVSQTHVNIIRGEI
jgi:hypothetical protein